MPLSASHRRALRALGDTLLPSTGPGDPAGGDVIPAAVDDLLAAMTPADLRRVGALLTAFDYSAVARYGRRFSALAEGRRRRYLEGWMTSRVAVRRIVYRALRSLCMNAYYQDPTAWPAMHYEGPLVSRGL
jgi:hypothetical protein